MATHFDRASLEHVAQLASLTLTDQEADSLASDMQRILAYVDELATVDTTDVEPTLDMHLELRVRASPASKNALRADELQPSLDRAAVLGQAPRATENGFLVPTFVVDAESRER